LLLKLAAAASLASILSRFSGFQRMLMREDRTLVQRVKLALGCSAFYGAGVATRVLIPAYSAVDLGLEGSLVSGMVGGYVTGLLSGILISIPAVIKGEVMSMPLYAGIGVLGGLLRDLAPEKEDIWRFSPLFSLRPAYCGSARICCGWFSCWAACAPSFSPSCCGSRSPHCSRKAVECSVWRKYGARRIR